MSRTSAFHQQAFEALRLLPAWPPTLEDAMRQPLAAAVLRLLAVGMRRGHWQDMRHDVPEPLVTPVQQLRPCAPNDFKRAAAGDTDDA